MLTDILLTDISPRIAVHDSYTSEDPSTWLFTVLLCWQTAHPTRGIPFPNEGPSVVSDLKAKVMESYGEPIRSIVGGLSEDDATAWVGYTVYWPTIPWPDHEARGRVSLIGDAMHALLPRTSPTADVSRILLRAALGTC